MIGDCERLYSAAEDSTGGIDYTARMWNPMSDLDSYAPYSPKIAKLKALIDLFALNYGRSEFE